MKSVKIIDDKGLFEFWVREDFPKLEEVKANPNWIVMHESKMTNYLHKEDGPAIKHLKIDYEQYYLNGKLLSDEEVKEFKDKIKGESNEN